MLAASGLLALDPIAAHAQTASPGPDPCLAQAGQAAAVPLAQAAMFTPAGYGPFGWGPLSQPFGPGPLGAATLFGPPGPVPAYGPLGPGLTSTAIAAGLPAGGFGSDQLNNTTQLDLATLQQAELGTLYSRYGLGASFQLAAATWGAGLTAEAAATRQALRMLCRAQQLRALADAASAAGSGTGGPAPGNAATSPPAPPQSAPAADGQQP